MNARTGFFVCVPSLFSRPVCNFRAIYGEEERRESTAEGRKRRKREKRAEESPLLRSSEGKQLKKKRRKVERGERQQATPLFLDLVTAATTASRPSRSSLFSRLVYLAHAPSSNRCNNTLFVCFLCLHTKKKRIMGLKKAKTHTQKKGGGQQKSNKKPFLSRKARKKK